jgi:hypothetical protein
MIDFCYPTRDIRKCDKSDLEWFFFSKSPEPYNLVYICHNLFEDDGCAELLRKKVIEIRKSPDSVKRVEKTGYRVISSSSSQQATKLERLRKEERRRQRAPQPEQGHVRPVRKRLQQAGFLLLKSVNV